MPFSVIRSSVLQCFNFLRPGLPVGGWPFSSEENLHNGVLTRIRLRPTRTAPGMLRQSHSLESLLPPFQGGKSLFQILYLTTGGFLSARSALFRRGNAFQCNQVFSASVFQFLAARSTRWGMAFFIRRKLTRQITHIDQPQTSPVTVHYTKGKADEV
jgi:hypothetical protein